MSDREGLHDLEDVLESLQTVSDRNDKVSIGDIQDEIGRRSFGPFLLVFGVIVLTPVGGIPGVPTAFGVIVLLFAVQLLIGKDHFWLPGFISNRSVDAKKLAKAAKKVQPAAKWIDRFLRPRMHYFVKGPAVYCVAVACVMLAVMLPALEIVPFGAAAPAAAITAFALALVAEDGLLALLGYMATGASIFLIVNYILV